MSGSFGGRVVRARAPLRLGFAGGGSDLSPFCDMFGGFVMNATIALYAYAHLEPRDDGQVLFEAIERQEVHCGPAAAEVPLGGGAILHRGVYNRIVRDFNGGRPLPVTLRTSVDVPSGSGLGGSSALVVAILEAYRNYLQLPLGEYDLARLAYEIERRDLKLAGGRQDQYAAAFGGFNFMEFFGDERVIVNPLRIRPSVRHELEASLLLYYTGSSRVSATIIEDQQARLRQHDEPSVEAMKAIKLEAQQMKDALLTGQLRSVAEILQAGWTAKKATAASVTTAGIERILGLAMEHGALAGKASGAGGGGFLMILCPPHKRTRILDALSGEPGLALPCYFSGEGATSWAGSL